MGDECAHRLTDQELDELEDLLWDHGPGEWVVKVKSVFAECRTARAEQLRPTSDPGRSIAPKENRGSNT